MKFAIFSVFGCDVPFAARLQDEGHEVLMFVDRKNKMERGVGEGLVPRTNNLQEWLSFGRHDREKTVTIFGGVGNGKLANAVRRNGGLVIGAGTFPDKLEEKRAWAERLSRQLGIVVPKHEEFENIAAAKVRAKKLAGEWVFKSDKFLKSSATYLASSAEDMVRYLDGLQKEFGDGGRCLLQRKIPGVAISTACWWNGKAFIGPFEGTIEHKKFLNDDLGPNTGCALNLVWMYRDDYPEIAESLQWRALEEFFRHSDAPVGIYDINALIGDDGNCYFLEYTPRFGYDSEPTAQRLLTSELGEFYFKLATGQLERVPFSQDHFAYSVRLSVPPYPTEENIVKSGKGSSVGVSIIGDDGLWDGFFIGYGVQASKDGGIEVSSPYGLVGLALSVGRHLEGLHKDVMKYLKDELQVPNLQYRTDGVERIREDLKKLASTPYRIKEVN